LIDCVIVSATAANDDIAQNAPDCKDITASVMDNQLAQLQYYFGTQFITDLNNTKY